MSFPDYNALVRERRRTRERARVDRIIRRCPVSLGRREAREALERLACCDAHDWLASREPGAFAKHFAREWHFRYTRPEVLEQARARMRAFARDKFYHYGPPSYRCQCALGGACNPIHHEGATP